MKRFFFLAAAFCMASIASKAQTRKGYYLIGGNIGNINANLQKNASSFGISVTPKAAWFVRDNLAVGGQVGLGYNTQKDMGNSFSYSIGPLARYYFSKDQVGDYVKGEFAKHTTFFAEANVGIAGNVENAAGSDTKAVSTNGFDVGIGPGVAYFINQNIALEALAKYNLTAGFGSTPVKNNIYFGVGFQIYLPGSKLKSIRNEMQ